MMRMKNVLATILCFACLATAGQLLRAQADASMQAKVLTPAEAGKLMPRTVFFRGQSATVQLRNTFGVRFTGGSIMLAGLVDSSGYSSGLQTKYQGYLLTEKPLTIEGKTLPAGAYGFGFVANNQFIVMDLGASEVLRIADKSDAKLAHPRPLMIAAGTQSGSYRLYEGRRFVSVRLQ